MKKMLMTTAMVTALFFGTLSANAACPCQKQGGMMPPPKPCYGTMKHEMSADKKAEMDKRKAEMDKRLGITEEQKAQLKSIHEKAKAQIAPKIKQLTEIEHELSVIEKREFNSKVFGINTLENVKLSGKTADQLKTEAKALQNEIRDIRKACFESSQAVFTEEQKAELKKMRDEHMKKMKNVKKHHKHHRHFHKEIKK